MREWEIYTHLKIEQARKEATRNYYYNLKHNKKTYKIWVCNNSWLCCGYGVFDFIHLGCSLHNGRTFCEKLSQMLITKSIKYLIEKNKLVLSPRIL